ncbi:MAG: type IV-A pilus assembly ATPase PilB [Nitrospinae bacterium]|nr:type IV-A pilus assembly ATPase PilB [Nitrospinota bacterium]
MNGFNDPNKKKRSMLANTVHHGVRVKNVEKLGQILLREGQITQSQLNEALDIQKKQGGRLGRILISMGYVEDETIADCLRRQSAYSLVKITERQIDEKTIKLLPYNLAKEYMAIPLEVADGSLLMAMADPTNSYALEDIQLQTKLSVRSVLATEKDIIEAFKKYYGIGEEEYLSFFKGVKEDSDPISLQDIDDFGKLLTEAAEEFTLEKEEEERGRELYSASDTPVVKLVNGILIKAIKAGASDIHIEPFEITYYVRYRLDGKLYKVMSLPPAIKSALVSRIKILAKLDISERRVPQDGRIKLKIGATRSIDFRVSTLPTLFGEAIVMRLLDKSSLRMDLMQLGFTRGGLDKFLRAINRPYGMVLVTGPTGSGKTTTLYSALSTLNTFDRKILTAEDPVEYNFQGINQVQIREEVGLTFASALRAFLRQDPDIIMVGEIRDEETAEIAVKAALTGHMLLSTLHTNDCPATITRLIDIGIKPYLVAAALSLVVSQRLLRRICPKCKEPVKKISREILGRVGFSPNEFATLKIFQGAGCEHCSGTGYKGRVAVYEVLEVTDEIRDFLLSNPSENQLRAFAFDRGMTTLRQEGIEKIKEGMTTVEEVLQRTIE